MVADEQWRTVKEEDRQNKKLITLSNEQKKQNEQLIGLSEQILSLTKEVRGYTGKTEDDNASERNCSRCRSARSPSRRSSTTRPGEGPWLRVAAVHGARLDAGEEGRPAG